MMILAKGIKIMSTELTTEFISMATGTPMDVSAFQEQAAEISGLKVLGL